MCLGAIYWARLKKMYYACNRDDAAAIDFDDAFIYEQVSIPIGERTLETVSLLREEGVKVFQQWKEKSDKTEY